MAVSFSLRGLLGVPYVPPVPRVPRLVWRSPAVHVAGPLCRSPCPAALRPLGLAFPPAVPSCDHHARRDPPARPGGFAHPRGAPLHSSRRGRAAAARVGTLCASAGRWGSPASALTPSSVGDAPPPPSGVAGPAVLFLAFLCLACGGSSGLFCACRPCRLWLSPGGVPPGLLNPNLTSPAFPLARDQGCVYPCVLMHVSCARMSPHGLTCLSGYVHGCGWVTLVCCPPTIFVSWRTGTVEDLRLRHGSARLLACFCLR